MLFPALLTCLALSLGAAAQTPAAKDQTQGHAQVACGPGPGPESLQQADGSWSARAVPTEFPGIHAGRAQDDLWVTAAMTLALLAERNTSTGGFYRNRVALALDWIRSRQRADGRLLSPNTRTDMLVHALATLALIEDVVLSGGNANVDAARRALAYLEARALESGGWNREGAASGTPDARTTVWASLAVASGRACGFEGESDRILMASAALETRVAADDMRPNFDVSCELLVRLLAGESAQSKSIERAAQLVFEAEPTNEEYGANTSSEAFFIKSLAAKRLGVSRWKAWARRIGQQLRNGDTWRGEGVQRFMQVDPNFVPEGSIAAASFRILTLDVYFNYNSVVGVR